MLWTPAGCVGTARLHVCAFISEAILQAHEPEMQEMSYGRMLHLQSSASPFFGFSSVPSHWSGKETSTKRGHPALAHRSANVTPFRTCPGLGPSPQARSPGRPQRQSMGLRPVCRKLDAIPRSAFGGACETESGSAPKYLTKTEYGNELIQPVFRVGAMCIKFKRTT